MFISLFPKFGGIAAWLLSAVMAGEAMFVVGACAALACLPGEESEECGRGLRRFFWAVHTLVISAGAACVGLVFEADSRGDLMNFVWIWLSAGLLLAWPVRLLLLAETLRNSGARWRREWLVLEPFFAVLFLVITGHMMAQTRY